MKKNIISVLIILVGSFVTINSVAKIQSLPEDAFETIYLGGGCFWGMQELLRSQPGVYKTQVGYMGDQRQSPTYDLVKTGETEFAETVKVVFDPQKTSLQNIIRYFFKIHDPTTLNQQGNDKGRQYRSVVFYTSDQQKKITETILQKVEKSNVWKKPIVTQIAKAGKFWPAEDEHQDYLQKNPRGYTCHFERKFNF